MTVVEIKCPFCKKGDSLDDASSDKRFYLIKGSVDKLRPKKKICVFTVTRPTLIFASDPMHFYTEFG